MLAEVPLFLVDTPAARQRLHELTACTAEALNHWVSSPPGGATPAPVVDPGVLAKAVASLDPCPDAAVNLADVLDQVGEVILANGVRPSDPRCVAHLHCPTLLSAAAAELAIGVTNQSMDSYDQAPAATLVEDHFVRWLSQQLGLPPEASGVLTTGGTASNLLGLFLAREHHASKWGHPAPGTHGLPPEARTWRILCSRAAHFSIQQAAAVLGLGRDTVVPVATDDHDRIDMASLDRVLDEIGADAVVALVGTAGTTDAGAIDPLTPLAERARQLGTWFHVDAAVGGALCLSDRLRPLITGIEAADSVTVDFHKLWWQPIGASALLGRHLALFEPARQPSAYLDRAEDDAEEGTPFNLVGRSLDTSRRFDALKLVVSLRATGRRQMATLLEHIVATVAATAEAIDAHPDLELLTPPSTVTVVFRWNPPHLDLTDGALDQVNTAIQRALFSSGEAVIGRTRTPRGAVALKFTVTNPQTTTQDLTALASRVADLGTETTA